MARKKRISFSEKKHSVKGIISLVIGIISIITLFVLFHFSALADGNGDIVLGLVGVILFLLSITGIVLGYQGYKEKDVYYYIPVIGIILNGIMFIILFLLYIVGLLI